MPVNSILTDTKKALGLAEEYTVFDQEIIMFVNSVFGTLNQLGIGPSAGYAIADASDTWDELFGTDLRFNEVKSYVYLRVRLLFDPPDNDYVMTNMRDQIEQAEWRINVVREDILLDQTPVPTHPIVLPEGSEV